MAADELAGMAEDALTIMANACATHNQAMKDFGEASAANNAMRALESLFRREAIIRVAIETAESTLTDLLNTTIRPLAAEVNPGATPCGTDGHQGRLLLV